jgi:hypothetical protein
MLFRLHREHSEGQGDGQGALVYFVTTTEHLVAARLGFVFTDGNAATAITEFYDDLSFLPHAVDWPLMHARYWSNTPEDGDRVRRRQAEFLVHRSVPLELIDGLAVIDDAVRSNVQTMLSQAGKIVPVHVRTDWYFDS